MSLDQPAQPPQRQQEWPGLQLARERQWHVVGRNALLHSPGVEGPHLVGSYHRPKPPRAEVSEPALRRDGGAGAVGVHRQKKDIHGWEKARSGGSPRRRGTTGLLVYRFRTSWPGVPL